MKYLVFFFIAFFSSFAFSQNNDCVALSNLIYNISKARDDGVPKSAMESEINRNIHDMQMKAFAITMINIVYRENHDSKALRHEVLKNCK